jgi:hypothetical protein
MKRRAYCGMTLVAGVAASLPIGRQIRTRKDDSRWNWIATDFAGVRSLIPFLDTTQLHVSAALGCVLS